MNKKFSTLVAALMAAGALVMPADMFAQLRYVGGKTYSNVDAVTKLPTKADEPTQQFIVFQDADGNDYVAVVQKGNKLAAVALDKAKKSQIVTINFVDKDKYTVTTDKQTLGFKGSGFLEFGSAVTEFPVNLKSGALKFGGDNLASGNDRYVKLDNKTFSVVNSSVTIKAKAISVDALEEVVKDQAEVVPADTKLDAGYFLLMDNGNVLTGNEDGTAKWTKKTNSNSYWKIEITSDGTTTGTAKFVNKGTGEYLTDASGKHIIVAVTRTAEDKPYQFASTGNENIPFTVAPAGDGVVNGIALGVIEVDELSSSELKTIFGSTFGATIKKGNDAVANNPFTGNLKPVFLDRSTGKVSELPYSTTSFMLQNGDGDIIVMKVKDKYADAKNQTYGYKLDAISPRDLARALSDTKTAGDYATYFTFWATEDFNVGEEKAITRITVSDGTNSYCLGSLNVSGKPTLSAENNALQYLDAISIELGLFNTVDVEKLLGTTPGFFTVTNKNINKKTVNDYGVNNYGKVLGVTTNGWAGYVAADEALVGYPETQWAVTYDDKNKELVFKNRENPSLYAGWEDLDGDGNYTDRVYFSLKTTELYNIPGKTNVYAYQGDTIEIKINTDYKESDGYVRYNNAEYEDQHYYVGVYSPVWNGSAWMVENHNNSHKVGLDTNKENATEWELTPAMEIKRDFDGKILSVTPDTVEIKSILGYYKDGNYTTTVDDKGEGTVILKFPAYALRNTDNNEYMAYTGNGNNQYYATGYSDNKTGFTSIDNANFFAVRIVGDNQYNLVEVNTNTTNYQLDEEEPLNSLGWYKVYGGDSADKGMLNQTYLYSQEENDIISIEAKEAPEYRKVAMGDTISIYRNEDPANVLFEKGEFLGIPTSLQLPDANPALFVDTAYVNRGNNNRWEYLLAVDAKHWESNLECEIPDHPKHHADTTTGRFLVNLMDSAYVYHDNNIHDNKFINEEDGEYYAKLGFVEGYHTHDTLYLKRPNGTYDAISMTREDYGFSIAKFAFRYVNNEDESFVIETGCKNFWASDEYRDNVSRGYLKWMNGVVVVVNDINNADVFNMNEDETRTPTANEEISAEEATVSVVATNGAVIVKGAEGKNVVVSTILGKVVANEVLNSDNETIAAPAGIVVVSVDGESFKVAVK